MPLISYTGLKRLTVVTCVLMITACSSMQKSPELSEAEMQAQQQAQALRAQQEGEFEKALKLQQEDKYAEAEHVYTDLLKALPASQALHFNLAHVSAQQDNEEKAIQYLDALLALNPAHIQALNMRGRLAREAGEFDQAEHYYRKALEQNPDFVPALRNLAILLDLYRGRLDEALALYQRVQALDDSDPRLKDWIFDLKRRVGEGS